MAEQFFTEHGALIRRSDDGTVHIRTAEGLKMIFPPNPVTEQDGDSDG